MEFFVAVFFLLFFYVRPQDWVPGLIGLNIIKPIIAVWLAVLLTSRSRESPLPGLLKTPHDWAMLAYLLYVVWNAPDSSDALSGFLPFVVFYAFTVQSVNTWPRLNAYFKWWIIGLTIVAILGVLIPLGVDLTGGKEYYERSERLALGTWIHRNPNALGHSVVIVIAASYFRFFWRGTILGRFVVFPVMAGLAYWCAYLTASKGAFLVGGILLAGVFVIGRPKMVQIVALTLALGMGVGSLSYLPRMEKMDDISSDEGVQGRLMAWEVARETSKMYPNGMGWKQFFAYIDWKDGDRIVNMQLSTHSSYVHIAADLGRYGLFLYLAGLWCVIHTLLSFRPASVMEDRCRRVLWILLLAYILSGWMINIQYHTEYFLLMAAGGALHRLAKGRELTSLAAAASATAVEGSSASLPEPQIPDPSPSASLVGDVPAFTYKTEDNGVPPRPLWNRFGVFDLLACIGLTWLTFWFWDYILKHL